MQAPAGVCGLHHLGLTTQVGLDELFLLAVAKSGIIDELREAGRLAVFCYLLARKGLPLRRAGNNCSRSFASTMQNELLPLLAGYQVGSNNIFVRHVVQYHANTDNGAKRVSGNSCRWRRLDVSPFDRFTSLKLDCDPRLVNKGFVVVINVDGAIDGCASLERCVDEQFAVMRYIHVVNRASPMEAANAFVGLEGMPAPRLCVPPQRYRQQASTRQCVNVVVRYYVRRTTSSEGFAVAGFALK